MGAKACSSSKKTKEQHAVDFSNENDGSGAKEAKREPQSMKKPPTHHKYVSSLAFKEDPDNYEGADKERVKIVHEIVNSEKIYLRGLQRIFMDFVDPLEASNILPENSTLRRFLAPINMMVEEHKLYYINMSFTENIADVFQSDQINFWSIYSMFINQYPNIIRKIKDLRKENPKVDAFFESREHDIEFYLIFPVQRIPRYYLYIKELLKHTNEKHADYEALQKAEKAVLKVCEDLNEQKRKAEKFSELKQLRQRIKNFSEAIWAPNRAFISEHKCWIPSKGLLGGYRVKSGVFFIFTDMILICNSSFEYERHVFFSYIDRIRQHKLSSQYPHSIFCSMDWEDDLIIVAKSKEEVQNWYEILYDRQQQNGINSFIAITSEIFDSDFSD